MPRASYNMSLSYELIHKIDTTSKDLGIPKHELIEKLLRLGLAEFLDTSKHPSNKPSRSARDLLVGLVHKVRKLEEDQDVHRSPKAKKGQARSSYTGVPSGGRQVTIEDVEPSSVNQQEADPEDDFGLYEE